MDGLVIAGLVVAALTLLVGGFLVWKGKLAIRNPVRAFAVVCVAVIATFVMWSSYMLNKTLASPQWCSTALGAEKATPGNTVKGLEACIELLTIQLNAVALNSHINFGSVALCLVVLIVIVVAGAKLDAALAKIGLNVHLGRQGDDENRAAAAAGARQAAGAATEEADDIASGAAPVPAAPAAAEPAKPAAPGKFTAPPGEEL